MYTHLLARLKLPNQEFIEDSERISELLIWALELERQGHQILYAGIGKPTYPINDKILTIVANHKNEIEKKIKKYKKISTNLWKEKNQDKYNKMEKEIIDLHLVVDYSHPQGEPSARIKIAKKVSDWYKVPVHPSEVLFTTGGTGGIYCVLHYINQTFPKGLVLTQFPYYSLYRQAQLSPIDVLQEPGYCLTARAISRAIALAKREKKKIAAFILCNPNNPLSTVISKEEWRLIIKELNKVPNALILLDEAYAEITFTDDSESLFSLASPSLRKRIIVLRSGTKGCSTAGNRMAILITQNRKLMKAFIQVNTITTLQSDYMSQILYSEIFPKRNSALIRRMQNFYKAQVFYVQKRLQQMGASLPDPAYHPEGSFYTIANLGKLMGMKLTASDQKLLKPMFAHIPDKIATDEHLAYWLLAKHRIMLCPLSYFGLDPRLGWLRITCSIGHIQLGKIMRILEKLLEKKSGET